MSLPAETIIEGEHRLDFIPQQPLTNSWSHYSTPPPASLKPSKEDWILGIDEAGRGPVLGPMVYAVAYLPKSRDADLKKMGVDDSKVLNDEIRMDLFKKMRETPDWIGFAVHVISPQDLSEGMLRVGKYNLNSQAHDSTILLIKSVLALNVNITDVRIDTVGPPDQYRIKLEAIFPNLNIIVAKKADSLYPSVSAASICAKVTRDQVMEFWSYIEPDLGDNLGFDFGSGYPSDPNTVAWLKKSIDPIFAFPRLVRFSWQTCKNLLEENAVKCRWLSDEDDGNVDIRTFFKGKKRKNDEEDSEEDVPKENIPIAGPVREHWVKCMSGLEVTAKF